MSLSRNAHKGLEKRRSNSDRHTAVTWPAPMYEQFVLKPFGWYHIPAVLVHFVPKIPVRHTDNIDSVHLVNSVELGSNIYIYIYIWAHIYIRIFMYVFYFCDLCFNNFRHVSKVSSFRTLDVDMGAESMTYFLKFSSKT